MFDISVLTRTSAFTVRQDKSKAEHDKSRWENEGGPSISCDYCNDGVVLIDGWHIIEDGDGIDGIMRIRCMES